MSDMNNVRQLPINGEEGDEEFDDEKEGGIPPESIDEIERDPSIAA